MKKLVIIILSVTCISVTAIAQTGIRIGKMEFLYRIAGSDTITQITEDNPCPPCPPENETSSNSKSYSYSYTFPNNSNGNKKSISDGYCGIGFILPDNGDDFYSVRGGNSFNIDLGGERRYHLSRRLAVGGLTQYSFYNYRLKPVTPTYLNEVIGRDINPNDVKKQVFRSHNLAAGVFARFYLSPPRSNGKRGMFMEAGAQGDFAFSKYCKLKLHSSSKEKHRDGYVFNPFTASATARVGWGSTVVFARYRFTDAFNKKELTTPMDLPRVTIGLQFF